MGGGGRPADKGKRRGGLMAVGLWAAGWPVVERVETKPLPPLRDESES